MIYLAGGDPIHLLHAYELAKENDGTLAFTDAKGRLRVPIPYESRVVIVGNDEWLPYLVELVFAICKSDVVDTVKLPNTEWDEPIGGRK